MTTKKNIERIPPHLYSFIKQKIDLSDFLSNELGLRLTWCEPKTSAKTNCPMPHHQDKNASFHVKFLEEDKMWVYNCFGCGAHGNIINFFMDYYGIFYYSDAALAICDKFSIKHSDVLVTDSIKDVKKKVNLQRKINCAHVVSSRQCFTLLKKDYTKYNKWVAEAYRTMNKALDDEDLSIIESIGFEARDKIQEK